MRAVKFIALSSSSTTICCAADQAPQDACRFQHGKEGSSLLERSCNGWRVTPGSWADKNVATRAKLEEHTRQQHFLLNQNEQLYDNDKGVVVLWGWNFVEFGKLGLEADDPDSKKLEWFGLSDESDKLLHSYPQDEAKNVPAASSSVAGIKVTKNKPIKVLDLLLLLHKNLQLVDKESEKHVINWVNGDVHLDAKADTRLDALLQCEQVTIVNSVGLTKHAQNIKRLPKYGLDASIRLQTHYLVLTPENFVVPVQGLKTCILVALEMGL